MVVAAGSRLTWLGKVKVTEHQQVENTEPIRLPSSQPQPGQQQRWAHSQLPLPAEQEAHRSRLRAPWGGVSGHKPYTSLREGGLEQPRPALQRLPAKAHGRLCLFLIRAALPTLLLM